VRSRHRDSVRRPKLTDPRELGNPGRTMAGFRAPVRFPTICVPQTDSESFEKLPNFARRQTFPPLTRAKWTEMGRTPANTRCGAYGRA
jgi:hypothetical protein